MRLPVTMRLPILVGLCILAIALAPTPTATALTIEDCGHYGPAMSCMEGRTIFHSDLIPGGEICVDYWSCE